MRIAIDRSKCLNALGESAVLVRKRRRAVGMLTLSLFAALLANRLEGQSAQTSVVPLEAEIDVSTIPLWSGDTGADSSNQSSLTVFRPQPGKANHAAVIVAPGGGYTLLTMNSEGRQVADWFTTRGFTAFVLKYRLGVHHPYPEPLLYPTLSFQQDASRRKDSAPPHSRVAIQRFH